MLQLVFRHLLPRHCKGKLLRHMRCAWSEGEPVELPQHEETTPLNSRVPYAVVKNVGESYFRSFYKTYGLPFTIFRFFNTYGPNQSEDFVITKFLRASLKGADITIYGDGTQTRTFCYVDDNINTCVKIFEENLMINDVINIGGAKEYRIIDVAKLIITYYLRVRGTLWPTRSLPAAAGTPLLQ